jgi:ribose 5-phosphate isomerase A
MGSETDHYKKLAAERAVELIEPGMVVGLGHGSTAFHAVHRVAMLFANGELAGVVAVPCSRFVEAEAKKLGIPLTTLEHHPVIDLTIDGADEVSPTLDLIKGGGGALLREKVVAQASRREVIVVDESKLSASLGTMRPVPVEVTPFGWLPALQYLTSLGGDVKLRLGEDELAFETDQGNYILDADFGSIHDPAALAGILDARAGVVCHGLFTGLATDLIVAGPEGVRHWVAHLREWNCDPRSPEPR